MLVDRMARQNRKLLPHADRNGHFYVLDRTNGKFLAAWPFIYQNWNAGFDEWPPKPVPGSNSSGQLLCIRPRATARLAVAVLQSAGPASSIWMLRERRAMRGTPQALKRAAVAGPRASSDSVRKPNGPRPTRASRRRRRDRKTCGISLFQGSLSNGCWRRPAGLLRVLARRQSGRPRRENRQHLWHFRPVPAMRVADELPIDGRKHRHVGRERGLQFRPAQWDAMNTRLRHRAAWLIVAALSVIASQPLSRIRFSVNGTHRQRRRGVGGLARDRRTAIS